MSPHDKSWGSLSSLLSAPYTPSPPIPWLGDLGSRSMIKLSPHCRTKGVLVGVRGSGRALEEGSDLVSGAA